MLNERDYYVDETMELCIMCMKTIRKDIKLSTYKQEYIDEQLPDLKGDLEQGVKDVGNED